MRAFVARCWRGRFVAQQRRKTGRRYSHSAAHAVDSSHLSMLLLLMLVVLLQPLQGAHAARQGVFDLYSYEVEFTAAPVWDSTQSGGNRNLDAVIVLAFRHPETNQQVRIRGNSASGRNAGVTPFTVGIGGNANGFNNELDYATVLKQGNATQPPFVLRNTFDDIITGYNETVAVYGGDFEFNGEQPEWHDAGDSDFIEIYPIIILDVSPEVCNYSTTDKLYTCADKTTFNVPYPGMPNAFDSADGIVYEPYGITVRFTFNCQQDSDCGNNANCTNGECLCDAGYISEVGDGYDCRELCDEMNDCPGENSVCDRTATEVGVCMCTDESLVLLETNYCAAPVTCNAGEYQTISEDGSMLECSPCPAGFFCPGTNNAARLCTPISTYSMEGASMCTPAVPGSFSVADSVTLDVTDIGDGQTPEYVGSYSEEVAFTIIYTSIDTCPAGFRCSGGVMEPCVDGMTYQDQTGQSVCEDCSACDDGFEVAQACNRTHNTACVDVDECAASPGVCGTGGACENIDGGFVCNCSEGYENDSDNNGICINIDECDVDPEICGPTNAICRDTDGSYMCECFGGYALNEETNMCEDIDECAAANDCGMINFSICVNLPGAYRCNCNDTFVESMRTSPTSVQCVCAEGFSPQGDPATCQDVDECEAANDCDSIDFSTCVNTVGAYRCDCDDTFVESMRSSATSVTCSCEDGFSPQGDPDTCVDVDECTTTPGICGTGGTCENIDGGFVCNCSEGYENDNDNNGICINIDECDVDPEICGPTNAICRDTDGSYMCECFGGYALSEETNMCEDIDECAAANDCDSIDFSICVNLPGAYRCDCDDTFVESMRTSDTSVTCSCEDGFSPQGDPITCENIDECMEGRDYCTTALPNSVCVDTIGSFECECGEGFALNDAQDECEDIDECVATPDVCGSNALCVNTYGGVECICEEGYKLDPFLQSCVDINECLPSNGSVSDPCLAQSSNIHCTNEPGSYSCTCDAGFVMDAISELCEDIDECSAQNTCNDIEHALCSNTFGGYRCECNDTFLTQRTSPTEITCVCAADSIVSPSSNTCVLACSLSQDGCDTGSGQLSSTAIRSIAAVSAVVFIFLVVLACFCFRKRGNRHRLPKDGKTGKQPGSLYAEPFDTAMTTNPLYNGVEEPQMLGTSSLRNHEPNQVYQSASEHSSQTVVLTPNPSYHSIDDPVTVAREHPAQHHRPVQAQPQHNYETLPGDATPQHEWSAYEEEMPQQRRHQTSREPAMTDTQPLHDWSAYDDNTDHASNVSSPTTTTTTAAVREHSTYATPTATLRSRPASTYEIAYDVSRTRGHQPSQQRLSQSSIKQTDA